MKRHEGPNPPPEDAHKSNDASGESEKKLIEAFRGFIKAEQLPKSAKPEQLRGADIFLLVAAFSCIWLALSLFPELFSKSESGKFILDKIVPWFLNLGALAAILKSPDTVLAATRMSYVRWVVPALLVFLILAKLPLFTVEADVPGYTTIWLDGRPTGRTFPSSAGHHDIEIKAADAKILARKFNLEFSDFFSGLTLHKRWMLEYMVKFDLAQDMTVCLEPDFEVDDDFIANSSGKFKRLNRKALEVEQPEGGLNVSLLAGGYKVTGFLEKCGVTQDRITSGPQASAEVRTLPAIVCAAGGTPSNPCDRYFKAGAK